MIWKINCSKFLNIFKFKNKNDLKKEGILTKIQILSQTFMLPIAMLAFCGILMGIGSSLTGKIQIKQMSWLQTKGIHEFFLFIKTVGFIGFILLPFFFAMSIPLGLASNNKGVAALAGFIAYSTLLFVINFMFNVLPNNWTKSGTYIGNAITEVIGLKTIDLGVLGAILVGLLVFYIHEKFQYIILPNIISFWGGKRFVPLFNLILFSIIGILLIFIWPGIIIAIQCIGFCVQKVGWFGPFLYRFTESLIRPTGLHHIINTSMRFTAVGGTFIDIKNTKKIVGALNIFFYQLENGLPIDPQYTRFLAQGYMPTVMFGLPAAAIAIYFCSFQENRKMVKSVIIPGIVTSVVSGITESIEFLFLFISPLLYFFHCIMIGCGYMILGLLEVKVGNADGTLIDLIIFGFMQGLQTKWYLVILVGIIFSFVYFVVFYFYIKMFNIQTIGRESKERKQIFNISDINLEKDIDFNKISNEIIYLLGGKNNIKTLNNCFTRLFIILNHAVNIEEKDFKSIGAIGVIIIEPTNIQIIFDIKTENIKNTIIELIK